MKELRTLTAITGSESTGDAIDPASLRKLVDALSGAGQLRSHWTADDAVDALAVLTSFPTYERLHGNGRSPDQIEGVLAKLAISIVAPSASTPPG